MPATFLRGARALTVRARRVRGGVFVGEAFRRFYGRKPRLVTVDDFDGTLTLQLDLAEHMQSQIFWHGFYSGEIAQVLKRTLRAGDTFIDGGANIGELTLLASKLVGKKGSVIAFEPLPALADQLERHVAMNHVGNVRVHRLGLFRRSARAPIFVAAERYADGTDHRGLGSLFTAPARPVEAATIELVSLDDFLRERPVASVKAIKLDIEGAELPALEGAKQTIERFRPSLIIEINDETCRSAGYEAADIFDFVSALGYRVFRIGSRGKLHRIAAADLADFQNVLCVPESGE